MYYVYSDLQLGESLPLVLIRFEYNYNWISFGLKELFEFYEYITSQHSRTSPGVCVMCFFLEIWNV